METACWLAMCTIAVRPNCVFSNLVFAGKVCAEEILECFRHFGIPATAADAQRMVTLLDVSQDKEVSYDEFCRFIIMLPASQVR